MIKSKSVFEFRGRHEVLDADGAVIGTAREGLRQVAPAQPLARPRRDRHRGARGARVELDRRAPPSVRRSRPRLSLAAHLAAVQLHASARRRGGRDVQARARASSATATCSSSSPGRRRRPPAAGRVHNRPGRAAGPLRTCFPIAAPAERERVFTISDDKHTPHRMYLRSARSDPPRGRMRRRLRTEARGRRGRRRRAIGRPEQLRRRADRVRFGALAVSSIWDPGETEPDATEAGALRGLAAAADAADVRLFRDRLPAGLRDDAADRRSPLGVRSLCGRRRRRPPRSAI